MKQPKLEILYKDPRTLKEYANNSRNHTDAHIDEIIEIVKELGFNDPIGVDSDDGIIEGHGRNRAAIKMGLDQVPTVCLSHLSPNQKRAYIIAHNKIGEKGGWNMEKLAEEMSALTLDEYDTSIMGFNEDELNNILKDVDFLPEGPPEGEKPAEEEKPKRSRSKSKVLHTCPNCKHEFTA
jgi:ParB-like chromosome segregation protein Spo0J